MWCPRNPSSRKCEYNDKVHPTRCIHCGHEGEANDSDGLAAAAGFPAPPEFKIDNPNIVIEPKHPMARKDLREYDPRPGAVNFMTAEEVKIMADKSARELGEAYGKLQKELMLPLVMQARFILKMPGDEPCAMTTYKDRVIIAQGNRLYELKQDVHDEYQIVDLSFQPEQPE